MAKIYYLNRLFPNNNFRDEDEKIIENIIEFLSYLSKFIIGIFTQMTLNTIIKLY